MRKLLCLFLAITIPLAFSACSETNKVSNETIKNDIKNFKIEYNTKYVPTSEFAYVSHKIIKRQTNSEDKEDLIYIEANFENQYFKITTDVEFKYNFYDEGGWILDEKTYEIRTSYALSSPDFQSFFDELYDYANDSYMYCNYNGNLKFTRLTATKHKGVVFDSNNQTSILNIEIIQGDVGKIYSHYTFKYTLENGWSLIEDEFENHEFERYDIFELDYRARNVSKVDSCMFDYTQTEGYISNISGSYLVSNINMENLTATVSHHDNYFGDSIYECILDPFSGELYYNKYRIYRYIFKDDDWREYR